MSRGQNLIIIATTAIIFCITDNIGNVTYTVTLQMRRSQQDTLIQGTFNATLDNPLSDDLIGCKSSTGKKRTAFVLGV